MEWEGQRKKIATESGEGGGSGKRKMRRHRGEGKQTLPTKYTFPSKVVLQRWKVNRLSLKKLREPITTRCDL